MQRAPGMSVVSRTNRSQLLHCTAAGWGAAVPGAWPAPDSGVALAGDPTATASPNESSAEPSCLMRPMALIVAWGPQLQ
ncbi:hypothetical protein I553_8122 [Mycobacterium xenopi 4042]|uniref:Uncharacterized protein n=1 Tax=Mycobacterium xenopi 4042 TaxID=1299334 RepID=X8DE58_MYCXE|nr:hypothetical protein I553_8122 [Mycobacterium xenopi 4042]